MKVMGAVIATLSLAEKRGYGDIEFDEIGVDMNHLISMQSRIIKGDEPFTEGKLNRWLGYIQGYSWQMPTLHSRRPSQSTRSIIDIKIEGGSGLQSRAFQQSPSTEPDTITRSH